MTGESNRDRGGADTFFESRNQPRVEGRLSRLTPQTIPINMYETYEDVVVVTPMPGVQAENIDIEVVGRKLTLRASMRGPGQEDRNYLLHEWTYGPYERTISLPADVDAEHANASHSNGVLAISIPKTGRSRSVRVPLKHIGTAEAIHEGHSGHHTTRYGLPGQETLEE